MTKQQQAELKKLLPKALIAPVTDAARYPNAILSAFPKSDAYSLLGCVTEEILRTPSKEIQIDILVTAIKKWYPSITDIAIGKICKSKTTAPFLKHIVATREKMEAVITSPLKYDEELRANTVEGHPDAITDSQIFEVKMTGRLKENWQEFLYQVFAYAALAPEKTHIYLVLPMQELLWQYDVRTWTKRAEYSQLLQNISTKWQTTGMDTMLESIVLRETFSIGVHTGKQKLLSETIKGLTDITKPYQIFLGGNQTSKMSIDDADLALTNSLVSQTGLKMFVHSQYIINLCSTPGDYNTELLIKNLQYAGAAGFKGVVVHVGKSTTRPLAEAMENMRTNLLIAIEHATVECPILLETPAGQGTETLTNYEEFVAFVLGFSDARIRICIDTCHVFATGYQPLEYIEKVLKGTPELLKLVHYNDSSGECGSCVDRHAYVGAGLIGMTQMSAIAALCHSHKKPMIIE
jgi:endonuclease IV